MIRTKTRLLTVCIATSIIFAGCQKQEIVPQSNTADKTNPTNSPSPVTVNVSPTPLPTPTKQNTEKSPKTTVNSDNKTNSSESSLKEKDLKNKVEMPSKDSNPPSNDENKISLKSLEGHYYYQKWINAIVEKKTIRLGDDYSIHIDASGKYEIHGHNQGLDVGHIDKVNFGMSGSIDAYAKQQISGEATLSFSKDRSSMVYAGKLYDKISRDDFVKIDDLNAFVADKLFKGEYISEKGEKYSFGKNATAILNGKNIKFELSWNTNDSTCEYFVSDDGKKIAFEVTNTGLKLYNTVDVNGILEKEEKPLAILTKVL